MINKEDVLEALQTVKNINNVDVVKAGIVSSVFVRGDSVGFALEVDLSGNNNMERLRKACEKAVKKLKGVAKVTAVLTTTRTATKGLRVPEGQTPEAPKKNALPRPAKAPVPGIKKIILVASGKGGVGKSTVAVNLAVSLARAGYNIGILDADVYGPSVPRMLNLKGRPEVDSYKRLTPFKSGNIQAMSMGNLIDEERAAVWRGPMATKALYQLFHGVSWNNIDYLIVDMPPGTGDIQLSLAENFPISGAVMVSTPQDVALADVRKAMDMFRKVNIPILGIIENMSYFEDPTSGNRSYIFGKGGAAKLAQSENLPFFGEIPLLQIIREGGDSGKPAGADAASMIGAIFDEMAFKMVNGPDIVR
jgi:ATP-binding protein involved in chromosome partitioning